MADESCLVRSGSKTESDLDEKIFVVLVSSTAWDLCMKLLGSFLNVVKKLAMWTAYNSKPAAVPPSKGLKKFNRANKELESKRK